MKKAFCDLCGNPAEYSIHRSYRYPAPNIGENVYIDIHSVITFVYHPAGFNGPPDLCDFCLDGLVLGLLRGRKPLPNGFVCLSPKNCSAGSVCEGCQYLRKKEAKT
jgi:hypothetical protein